MRNNGGLSFYRRKKRISAGVIKEIFSWITGILVAVFIAGVLNYFLGMSTNVAGVSMEPGLYNGQRIFIDRFSYTLSKPKADDVIVFLPNGNRNAHYYVKRVVAVPGDVVLIRDGRLYVNGEICNLIPNKITDPGIAINELLLNKNEFFCIGDNHTSSEDSRSADIGPVHSEDIIGKVWFSMGKEKGSTGLVK